MLRPTIRRIVIWFLLLVHLFSAICWTTADDADETSSSFAHPLPNASTIAAVDERVEERHHHILNTSSSPSAKPSSTPSTSQKWETMASETETHSSATTQIPNNNSTFGEQPLTKRPFDGRVVIEVNVRVFGALYNWEGQKYQNCGGTLISTRHVLTAAHCFFDADTVCGANYTGTLAQSLARDRISVNKTAANDEGQQQAGFSLEHVVVELDGLCLPNKFCESDSCACLPPNGTREVGVSRLFIQTAFVHSHCAIGDIAVLELAEDVAPRRVQLARWDTPIPHPVYASGYGYNPKWKRHIERDQLMTVNVSVVQKCPSDHATPDAICADETAAEENVCQGDSGSALRDKKRNIFGIVAYGTLCDVMLDFEQRGLPRAQRHLEGSVYTNVTYYLPFICARIGAPNGGCRPEDSRRAGEQPFFEIARNGQINGSVADFEVN